MNALQESILRMKAGRKEKDLLDAIDAVLAWWDKHKDDTYSYTRDGYGYDGDMFDSGDVAVFDKLRDERGKYEKSS